MKSGLDDNSVKLEFERISGRILYFDTNVISYLSSPLQLRDENLRNKAIIAFLLVTAFIDKQNTAFPYSMAHLRDIESGNELFETQRIKELEKHSGGWKISGEPNSEFVRLDKIYSITDDYFSLKKSSEQTRKISNIVSSAFSPLFKQTANAVATQLKAPKTIINKNIAQRIVSSIANYNSNSGLEFSRIVKQLRSMKVVIDGKQLKFPTLKKDVVALSRDELIGTVDAAIKEMNLGINGHKDFFDVVTKQFKNNIYDKYTHQIILLSSLCDTLGITSEKLKKDCSFDGMITDAFHLSYGLRSNYFVTEDKNLLIKAKFIKKWLQLPVSVFNLNDIILEIIISYLKQTGISNKSKELVIKIAPESGDNNIRLKFDIKDGVLNISVISRS